MTAAVDLRRLDGRRVKAQTVPRKALSQRFLARERALYPVADHNKPATRRECASNPGPCPYVSCKWHLYLEVNERTGSIRLNFPHLEVHELAETCALDVAEQGGATLAEIGALLNLDRERVRQVQEEALSVLRHSAALEGAR